MKQKKDRVCCARTRYASHAKQMYSRQKRGNLSATSVTYHGVSCLFRCAYKRPNQRNLFFCLKESEVLPTCCLESSIQIIHTVPETMLGVDLL